MVSSVVEMIVNDIEGNLRHGFNGTTYVTTKNWEILWLIHDVAYDIYVFKRNNFTYRFILTRRKPL